MLQDDILWNYSPQKRARDDESGENDENDETAPAGDDDETANAAAAAAAASALEPCVANALRCLIDLTRTVATRLRVVNAGGIGPACRLMDADVFAEALAERAVARRRRLGRALRRADAG